MQPFALSYLKGPASTEKSNFLQVFSTSLNGSTYSIDSLGIGLVWHVKIAKLI